MTRFCVDCVHYGKERWSCDRQYDPPRYNLVTGQKEYRLSSEASFERSYTRKQVAREFPGMDVCGIEAVYFMPNPERPWAGMEGSEEVSK